MGKRLSPVHSLKAKHKVVSIDTRRKGENYTREHPFWTKIKWSVYMQVTNRDLPVYSVNQLWVSEGENWVEKLHALKEDNCDTFEKPNSHSEIEIPQEI